MTIKMEDQNRQFTLQSWALSIKKPIPKSQLQNCTSALNYRG